jgi:RNA polymerase sigma-70 factor (ECF subfamily)
MPSGWNKSMSENACPDNNALPILVASHRQFLAFLERRTGNRANAEEILQTAFAKAVEHEASLKEESVVAWFFGVLRNALVDHYRRQSAEQTAIEGYEREATLEIIDEAELDRNICECFRDLLPTLKGEYANILKAVDLEGQKVVDVAEQLGLTSSNAGVRLHRARLALRKRLEETCRTCAEHGCFDCTCKKC